jgi:hypothetical protein
MNNTFEIQGQYIDIVGKRIFPAAISVKEGIIVDIQQISEAHSEHRELPFKSTVQHSVQFFCQELQPIETPVSSLVVSPHQERNHAAPHNLAVNDYFHFWHPPQL